MKAHTHEARQLKHSDSVEFILAGDAHVTFKNTETGIRYTYNIVKSKGKNPVHFVKVMYGSDNNGDYMYIGCIFDEKEFKHTKASRIKEDDVRFKGFAYVFSHLLKGDLNPKMEIWHEGRCGRCGRLLTVPESIETGFGPECASRMHVIRASRVQIKAEEAKPIVEKKERVPADAVQGTLFLSSDLTGEPIEIEVTENDMEVECSFDQGSYTAVTYGEGGFSGFASDCGMTALYMATKGIPRRFIINVKDYGRLVMNYVKCKRNGEGETTEFIYSDGKSNLVLFND